MYFDLWYDLFYNLLYSVNNPLSVDSIKLISGFFAVMFICIVFCVIMRLFNALLGLKQ